MRSPASSASPGALRAPRWRPSSTARSCASPPTGTTRRVARTRGDRHGRRRARPRRLTRGRDRRLHGRRARTRRRGPDPAGHRRGLRHRLPGCHAARRRRRRLRRGRADPPRRHRVRRDPARSTATRASTSPSSSVPAHDPALHGVHRHARRRQPGRRRARRDRHERRGDAGDRRRPRLLRDRVRDPRDDGDYDVRYFSPEAEVAVLRPRHDRDRRGAGRARRRRRARLPHAAGDGPGRHQRQDGAVTATLTSVVPHVEDVPDDLLDAALHRPALDPRRTRPGAARRGSASPAPAT